MATRSLTRELALLVLGQVPEQKSASVADLALDSILDQALDTLTQHWRESLDASAARARSGAASPCWTASYSRANQEPMTPSAPICAPL